MKRPLPTVNFLLDANSAAAAADGVLLDPANYRDVVSRTDRGNRVNPNAIIGVSLWALLRRVMLLEPACIWPGCDQPHSWCHPDHLTSWS